MAFENLQAEIGILMTRMQNEPEDRHELYLQLMEKLNEIKAYRDAAAAGSRGSGESAGGGVRRR